MRRKLAFNFLLLLFVSILALAQEENTYQERVLSYDRGEAVGWERMKDEGAKVDFVAPTELEKKYVVNILVFTRKYGTNYDPEKGFVNVAVVDRDLKVLGRKLVPLSHFADETGWSEIEIDPVEVKDNFSVVVYPLAQEGYGVEIAYSDRSTKFKSYRGNPSVGFKRLEGGKDWMIRVTLRNSIKPRRTVSVDQISGKGFYFYDDGSAEGFATFQRGGALVGFRRDGLSMVREVYIYAKAGGDWLQRNPKFRVFLLDHDLRIITSTLVDYAILGELPEWVVVDFPDTHVKTDFYILVEPGSRPEFSMLIGYDTSKRNENSLVGTVGSFKKWPPELQSIAPKLNWMVRLRAN